MAGAGAIVLRQRPEGSMGSDFVRQEEDSRLGCTRIRGDAGRFLRTRPLAGTTPLPLVHPFTLRGLGTPIGIWGSRWRRTRPGRTCGCELCSQPRKLRCRRSTIRCNGTCPRRARARTSRGSKPGLRPRRWRRWCWIAPCTRMSNCGVFARCAVPPFHGRGGGPARQLAARRCRATRARLESPAPGTRPRRAFRPFQGRGGGPRIQPHARRRCWIRTAPDSPLPGTRRLRALRPFVSGPWPVFQVLTFRCRSTTAFATRPVPRQPCRFTRARLQGDCRFQPRLTVCRGTIATGAAVAVCGILPRRATLPLGGLGS